MSQPKVVTPTSQIATEAIIFPDENLWSNEPPLESDRHWEQIDLLIRLIKWWWRERTDFYAAGNLTVYYSPNQKTSEYFRGPDFFVVLGTEKKDRRSWVLRFSTPEGMLVPLPEEDAQQKAEQAEQSIRNAVLQMLAMGLNIEQVAQVLNLSLEQVQQFNTGK